MSMMNRVLFALKTLPLKNGGQKYISTVAVIGAGVMGSGIAQVAATNGNRVFVYDIADPFLEATRVSIDKSLSNIAAEKFPGDKKKADEFVKGVIKNLNYTTDLKAAFDDSELVIEAIYENLEAKRRLFAKLENDKIADDKVIFATNTLNLSIADISRNIKRKDKFAGVRFFFPVPRTKMVEITRTDATSDKTLSQLTEWTRALGKQPVQLVDTPDGSGIVSRLPVFRKAISILERGDASKEEVDAALKANFAKGPLESMDSIGIDIVLSTMETLSKRYPNDPVYAVPDLLRKMVKEGKIGEKKGQGFYSYK